MTISSCEKEIKELIDNKSVVGLEAILNAIVRATDGKPWMKKDDVLRYLIDSYKMEEYWKENRHKYEVMGKDLSNEQEIKPHGAKAEETN